MRQPNGHVFLVSCDRRDRCGNTVEVPDAGLRLLSRLVPLLLPSLLMTLLIAASGCRKSEPALVLRVTEVVLSSELDWESVPPSNPERVSDEELVALAEKGLKRAGILVVRAPESAAAPVEKTRGPGDFRLRMTVQLAPARSAPTAASGTSAAPAAPSPDAVAASAERLIIGAALELTALSALRSRIRADSTEDKASAAALAPELRRFEHLALAEKRFGAAAAEKGKSGPGVTALSVAQLLRKVVEESSYVIGAQLQLITKGTYELKRVAGDKAADSALRRVAVTLLGLRKERGSVPILVEIIKDRTQPRDLEAAAVAMALRDAALGALIEIGDQSAVRPLLDAVSFRERAEMTKLLEAAAALGGDEARRYLTFVGKSHPEPTLREAAKTALEHLERRAAARSAESTTQNPANSSGAPQEEVPKPEGAKEVE